LAAFDAQRPALARELRHQAGWTLWCLLAGRAIWAFRATPFPKACDRVVEFVIGSLPAELLNVRLSRISSANDRVTPLSAFLQHARA
jgi:hypothetical protein